MLNKMNWVKDVIIENYNTNNFDVIKFNEVEGKMRFYFNRISITMTCEFSFNSKDNCANLFIRLNGLGNNRHVIKFHLYSINKDEIIKPLDEALEKISKCFWKRKEI